MEKIKRVKASQIPDATNIEGFKAFGIKVNTDGTVDNVKVPMDLLKGNKGDTLTWDELTQEQKSELAFTFEDFTAEQIEALKVKGDAFTFEDFTAEQIEALKVKGDKGDANSLSIGTVESGASAGASITGEAPNQTLNLTLPKGDTGSNIELQKTTTHVQWRVVGGTWANLIPLSDLKGDKGDNISLQKTATHIQWRLGTGTWVNLVALTELKGDKGDPGENAVMTIGTITTVASEAQANATVEPDGVDAEGKPKFKLNLWLPRGVDGEGAGDMLESIYDPQGKNTDIFGYVDGKVKTDVPENAKFTDTTYNEISEAEINTGTASDLRTITARRITYILSKVQALINSAISALTKSSVGLGNVDNVKQIPYLEKGANNGVAELDSTGKVLSSQLPSYVNDVLEYTTLANFPATGETGKIYIAINTNLTYRWTGTAYTEISQSIALGETSATAYRGDRGKIAYDHSQVAHAPANAQKNSDITKAEIEAKLTGAITSHTHAYASTSHTHNAANINAGTLAIARIPTGTTSSTVSLGNHTHSNYVPTSRTVAGKALTANITLAKGDVGLGNVDNTSDANKPVSTAQQTALNAKMDSSKFQVVESLPASPVSGTFYFVKE